jgi:hypothetical protein
MRQKLNKVAYEEQLNEKQHYQQQFSVQELLEQRKIEQERIEQAEARRYFNRSSEEKAADLAKELEQMNQAKIEFEKQRKQEQKFFRKQKK